jgi:hypothetical protein
MTEIPLGLVKFNDNVEFSFPNNLCSNCGKNHSLKIVEQDTRQTTYLFGGGTEITFKLLLPFCENCIPSSKRRPKNLFHRALGLLVSFGVAALALIIVGDLVLNNPAFATYLVEISLFFAACVTAAWIALSKPKGPQTSYFQPVRIPKLKREFVSGIITAIGFSFTNSDYARAFSSANRISIEKKVLSVTKA